MCRHLHEWKSSSQSKEIYEGICKAFFKNKARGQSNVKCIACVTCGQLVKDCQAFDNHMSSIDGHCIGIDLGAASLYCNGCQDTVYDADFDAQLVAATAILRKPAEPPPLKPPPALGLQTPECAESAQLAYAGDGAVNCQETAARRLKQAGASDGLPAGLRGLVNLGNTCFMSTVLHAFIHAPPLRTFYLGSGHPNLHCPSLASKSCLSCELGDLFSAAYSGDRKPLSPSNFLATWWQHAGCLAGYQQQDAHEFFLFALSGLDGSKVASTPTPSAASPSPAVTVEATANGLPGLHVRPQVRGHPDHDGWLGSVNNNGFSTDQAHADSRQPSPAPRLNDLSTTSTSTDLDLEGSESSIVDHTFGGALRSDVTCTSCGTTSSVHETFLALSLDVDPADYLPQPLLKPASAPRSAAVRPAPTAKGQKRLVGAATAASAKATRKRARLPEIVPALPISIAQPEALNGGPNVAEKQLHVSSNPEGTISHENAKELKIMDAAIPGEVSGGSAEQNGTSLQPNLGSHDMLSSADLLSSPQVSAQSKHRQGAVKKAKPTRCGSCHTCRNKHLKKACQRNASLKKQAEALQELHAAPGLSQSSDLRLMHQSSSEVAQEAHPMYPDSHDMASGRPGGASQPQESNAFVKIESLTRAGPAGSTRLDDQTGIDLNSQSPPSESRPSAPEWQPGGGKGASSLSSSGCGLTVVGCLRRFVRSELVSKWSCAQCTGMEGSKQVSIRRLPQVLCLHLKRFQHPGTHGLGSKLDTVVSYPTFLDMRPFLTASVLKKRYAWRSFLNGSTRGISSSNYELYAIVCHKGKIQGGHYIVFLKCSDKWYECNDHRVDHVSEAAACSSQAYMLFYRISC